MGERQFTQAKTELREDRLRRGNKGVCWIIGLAVLLLVCDSALADFLVQPMVVRRTVQPGTRVSLEMKLENIDMTQPETLTLRLAELTQRPDASWTEILAGDPNLSQAVLRSCSSWVSLPAAPIQVPPLKVVPFKVQVDIPAGTRGYYFAALVASTEARRPANVGVMTPVKMEMVVPIILEIQSIAVRREISLTDIGLEFRPRTTESPAASLVTLNISNDGGSFSRVLPVIRLWGQSGEHWLKIGEMKLQDIMIMPGAKLHLTSETDQVLNSGNYRLEGFVWVDSRRGGVIRKDVQFEGASTGPVRGEVALTLKPDTTFIDSFPGSTRSAYVQVLNGYEEDVIVKAEVALPAHMAMVQNNQGVKGEELGCADWVTVMPNQFTLRGHARQNLSIVCRMPKQEGKYPDYFGDLKLHVFYRDGKFAGTKKTLLCVQNKQGTGTTLVRPTTLSISQATPSRYVVAASCANFGETPVAPTCEGVLSIVGAGGGPAAIYKRFLMTSEADGQTGILLPFETRTFSGVLDLSDVPKGNYYVTALLHYPGLPPDGLQKQTAIIIDEQGGQKVAKLTEAAQQVVIRIQ